MNISNYEDGFFRTGGQELVYIVECGLIAMVAITEKQVKLSFGALGLWGFGVVIFKPFFKKSYVRLQAWP